MPSPRRVGWTMWEATRLPDHWLRQCQACEKLIVPSSGQIPIFAPSGVPIEVGHDGIDTDVWVEPEEDRNPDPEVFTFIMWARLNARKCPVDLVECFQYAFPHEKDVRLIIKTLNHQFQAGIMGIPTINDTRIEIINEDWPTERLVKFCHEAHCGVFLSHGEGSYNPPTQAMATGLPVILPNHSGCVDQANEKYNYPVGLDPVTPFSKSPYSESYNFTNEYLEWWNMDLNAVIETMRHVYLHREEAFAKGKAAAKWMRTKFTMDHMADGLLNAVSAM